MTPHAYSNYTRSHSKFPVTALAQVALSYTKFPVNTIVMKWDPPREGDPTRGSELVELWLPNPPP